MGDEVKEFASDKQEQQFLSKTIVTEAFQPIAKRIRRNSFINMNEQFHHFLKSIPRYLNLSQFGITQKDWDAEVEQIVSLLKDKSLGLSDTTIYLYLFDLITGKKGERDIRFVFVDEVQDYTPFQLAFLKYSFPRAKFTFLGDLNQAIFTKGNAANLQNELIKLFKTEKAEVIKLTQTYRSTQQITDFTKLILQDGADIEAFNRDGQIPNVIVSSDQNGQFTALLSQLDVNNKAGDTTAIITKTAAAAEELSKKLTNANKAVTLIASENQRLASGDLVVPSYLAKGLEFDAVIVWNANADVYSAETDRQLLYTIASRAMHRLTILSDKKLTPLLDKVPQNLYSTEKFSGRSKSA
jgi:DNA helicase-2/ATP-dependent DNA helicase PcrA